MGEVACVLVQAVSFVPLASGGGRWERFPYCSYSCWRRLYWGGGMSVRASLEQLGRYADSRNRIRLALFRLARPVAQMGLLLGFVVGGLWLEFGHSFKACGYGAARYCFWRPR